LKYVSPDGLAPRVAVVHPAPSPVHAPSTLDPAAAEPAQTFQSPPSQFALEQSTRKISLAIDAIATAIATQINKNPKIRLVSN